MSEPDRFDKQAREIWDTMRFKSGGVVGLLAAALRGAEASALERAAREAEALSGNYDKDRAEIADSIAARIRALIPLAAAPAEDSALESMCDCGRHVEGEKYALPAGGHVRAAHVDAPAAETGKEQGAEAPCPFDEQDCLYARQRIAELEALVGRCEEALLVPDPRKERKLLADLAMDRNRPRAAPPEGEGT